MQGPLSRTGDALRLREIGQELHDVVRPGPPVVHQNRVLGTANRDVCNRAGDFVDVRQFLVGQQEQEQRVVLAEVVLELERLQPCQKALARNRQTAYRQLVDAREHPAPAARGVAGHRHRVCQDPAAAWRCLPGFLVYFGREGNQRAVAREERRKQVVEREQVQIVVVIQDQHVFPGRRMDTAQQVRDPAVPTRRVQLQPERQVDERALQVAECSFGDGRFRIGTQDHLDRHHGGTGAADARQHAP